ncbi:Malate dehydrogenase (oxaloacetate-decarboxylating) (NADP(+)) [Flexistipes sinusarabici DSM 4947]|uniref:Malate dehydrogenase (Oxaloacetate-decarboxylating) (NADP(+)) n=3 Tax=Flexistipes sinusarabici TaxID=2352 RepID=F8E8A2_FLESM|nr:NADP-dependent malic enzyme [Flexistipes sinusarabici]AEI14523.1 Malate dehydrogenase (oxaloacetate-decarboxylating) (NADP(+)) [Flexistipes sinusarabici DSM 4947]AEI15099.1 Malate dehydrogenase (oxaloacetate-decarboxylating) (NADP(+)) [Flexistipes sinusarabici DSM 4947]
MEMEKKGKVTKEEALEYHMGHRHGKIEVVATKPCFTQRELSLAYSPGVSYPCLEIENDPEKVYDYTAKGNLVAVLSNGTAVLGLGNIGAAAGKPVMEGKGVLFKRFADVDVFDIEVNSQNPDEVIKAAELIEPTFGGINLEDIKAPDCFYIEETLRERLNIPVFHDDQHGTAIIALAALLNASEIVKKEISDLKVVINGAGASAIAIAKLIISTGVKKENVIMCDSKGVIYQGRTEGINKYKEKFAVDTDKRTLLEAMDGADVFLGLSVKGAVTKEMVKMMNRNPIIMAMANPDPEITPEEVEEVRGDAIMATGRSDYPNQVNNVLGFPFIFRGALDVRATAINEEMKLAAAKALAELARQDVPESVCKAYGLEKIEFGKEYIIPKPFDPRVLTTVAPAVAQTAMETGVARVEIKDWDKYKDVLESRLSIAKEFTRQIINKARFNPKKIVMAEGNYEKILRASQKIVEEGFATPVILGDEAEIKELADINNINLEGCEIIDPAKSDKLEEYAEQLFNQRQRKGMTKVEAKRRLIRITNYYGSMMVLNGEADCMLTGFSRSYPESVKPFLETVPLQKDYKVPSGSYFMVFKENIVLCADTTVNIDPDAEQLAEIALQSTETWKKFDTDAKIAMLSFTNFGSVRIPRTKKVSDAMKMVKEKHPELIIDGDMQADTATYPPIAQDAFPFSAIQGDANTLVFPNLEAGNIAYKLLYRLGGGTAIGPILQGFCKSVHVLQRGSDVNEIVNMAAIAVVDAHYKEQHKDEICK